MNAASEPRWSNRVSNKTQAARQPRRQMGISRMAEELVAVRTQLDLLTQQVTKNTIRLEGNGHPGLLEDVSKLQSHATESCDEFTNLKARIGELAAAQAQTQKQLDQLVNLVERHVDPANLEHETLARLWFRSPGTVVKWAGVALVVLLGLQEVGVLKWLGGLMSGLH